MRAINHLRNNLLPLSYVPEKAIRLNREFLRYGASLVKIQTGVKNKIHTILAKGNVSHGYSDLFDKEGMGFLHSLAISQNYRIALEGYLGSTLDKLEKGGFSLGGRSTALRFPFSGTAKSSVHGCGIIGIQQVLAEKR